MRVHGLRLVFGFGMVMLASPRLEAGGAAIGTAIGGQPGFASAPAAGSVSGHTSGSAGGSHPGFRSAPAAGTTRGAGSPVAAPRQNTPGVGAIAGGGGQRLSPGNRRALTPRPAMASSAGRTFRGNAWTDAAGSGRAAGTYLDPGTFGATLNYRQPGTRDITPARHRHRDGARRFRGYYPAWYGYYGSAYPFYVDSPFTESFAVQPTVIEAVAAPVVPTPAYYGGEDAQPEKAAAPEKPVQPGTDKNAAAAKPTENGPDSLVEAVQSELAKRGYFHGKVDAMFSDDTRVALRQFQQEHYLAPTGRLNEPTLHALQLD